MNADPYLPIDPVRWVTGHAPGLPEDLMPVLLVFAKHADAKGKGAFPRRDVIAAMAGCSESTAKRAVKRLQAMRLLVPGDQALPARMALPANRRPPVFDLPVHLRRGDVHLAGEVFDLSAPAHRGVTAADPPKLAVRPSHAEAAMWAREIAILSQRLENCFGPAEFAEIRHHLEAALLNGWDYGALIRFMARPTGADVPRAVDLIGRVRAHPYPPGDPRATTFKPEPVRVPPAPEPEESLPPVSEWDGWGHVDAIHDDVVPVQDMHLRYARMIVLWLNREHIQVDQLNVDELRRLLCLAFTRGHTSGSLVRLLDEPVASREQSADEILSRARKPAHWAPGEQQ